MNEITSLVENMVGLLAGSTKSRDVMRIRSIIVQCWPDLADAVLRDAGVLSQEVYSQITEIFSDIEDSIKEREIREMTHTKTKERLESLKKQVSTLKDQLKKAKEKNYPEENYSRYWD